MNIEIPTKLLKAAMLAAPKKDVRSYLNTVHLEITNARVIAVATDGRVLFAGRAEIPECGHDTTLLIPRETVFRALQGHKAPEITLIGHSNETYSLGMVNFSAVEGTYPSWRRIIPKKLSGELGHYSSLLISQIHKVLAAWDETVPGKYWEYHLEQNGDGAALAFGKDPNGFCVIVPRHPLHSVPNISWAYP